MGPLLQPLAGMAIGLVSISVARLRDRLPGAGRLLQLALATIAFAVPAGGQGTLLGYWSFDGDGADASGGGRDLVLAGGVGFAAGLNGQALDLHNDGSQYAVLPADDDIFDFGAGDFTIQVWVNFNSLSREQTLVEKLYGPAGPGWSLTKLDEVYQHALQFGFGSGPGTITSAIAPPLVITTGEWHQIIARRNGSVIQLLYDGTVVAEVVSSAPIPDTTMPLLIGKRNDFDGRNFAVDGRIDEVAIWSGAQAPPDPDLLGHWRFDDDGADAAGGGRNLDLAGGAGFAEGRCGQALDLHNDGSQYAIRAGDDTLLDFGAGDFTIQVWVNFNSLSREQTLVEKLYGPAGPGWSLTKLDEAYQHALQFGFGSGPGTITSAIAPPLVITTGEWHQIIARRNGSVIQLFYDGTVVAEVVSNAPIPDTTMPLLIGKRNDFDGRNFAVDGRIDEVRIYRVALTSQEIAALYANPCGLGTPPTACAGQNQSAHPGDVVMLDGSGSFDDDTVNLLYAWSFDTIPAGSAAVLSGADTSTPTFLVDLLGTYVVQLVVTDEAGLSSEPDEVVVSSENVPPTARAGEDQGGVAGFQIGLDGSASDDPDGDPISFAWSFFETPAGSAATLSGATTATPSLLPDLPGIYVVRLVVHDGFEPSESDDVRVTVISGAEFAENTTMDALELVVALPASSVTTSGNQRALGNFLSQAIEAIQIGDVATAQQKLAQAIGRTDGCALRGSPDGNGPGRDWITSCADQQAAYDLLQQALAAIQ